MNKTQRIARASALAAACLGLVLQPWSLPAAAAASSASSRPQVVIAIGNSQSMDGDLGGAIMTGSGHLPDSLQSLYQSSSPQDYTVPTGFQPPLTPTQTASAPYTVSSNGVLYDNSASRLNVAKAGIGSVLGQYLGSMDFALEDYQTSGVALDTTLVYYMSPANGFQFADSLPANGFTSYAAYQAFVGKPANAGASPAATRWVVNPCYDYNNASSDVQAYCQYIDSFGVYPAGTLSGNRYMQIAASSDDPDINDVLSAQGVDPLSLDYAGPYALNAQTKAVLGPITASKTPYTYFSLSGYETGQVAVGYTGYTDYYSSATTPTNAGYVAYTPQVMYAQRGFGYYGGQSATGGNSVVGMTTNLDSLTPGSSSFASTLSADQALFTSALAAETNSPSSGEIKAAAGQAATAGLLQGAGSVLSALTPSCSGQYVILVTDGLPTMDLKGRAWPPLGSAAGHGYGVTAAFYGVAGNSAYGIVDDSGNLPSGQTQGALDAANTNDQALADTISAIQALAKKGIKTYVIGLGAGVDASTNPAAHYALNAMAIAGGTLHEYPANDVPTFASALGTIAASIYGDVIASAPAVPGYVQNGTLAYVLGSNNQYGSEHGLFDAFSTDANGNVSSSPVWQLQMTQAQRQVALYTDGGSGTGVSLLSGQSAGAFGNPSSPSAQTIIGYTINPDYGSGAYLAGRSSTSFLGTITSQADKPVILGTPNNPYFIGSTSYRTFAQTNAGRQPLVLFTSNDGFLYAISSSSSAGTLQWAWMPSVLLPQLQNYTSFQKTQPMNGGLLTVDSADSTGNWATYVAGTAQSGALHYDLRLTSCSASTTPGVPTSCTPQVGKVWLDQQSGATSAPQVAPQAPQIWWDAGDVAYAYYFTTTGSGSTATSYLHVMRLYDGATSSYPVSFTPSSTVYVNVPAGQLYVGDSAGNLWSFDVTAGSSVASLSAKSIVATAQEVATEPNASTAGAVRYLGEAQTSSGIYLWATNDHQVNVFKFTGGAVSTTSSTGWTPWWWSSTAGSGAASITTNSNGTTTATMVDTSSNPGVGSTSAPYWLDSGSTITDASKVEASTLIVPVSISSASSCSLSTAQYDFFDLAGGTFPQKKFYDLNKNYLTSNPVIGLGIAFSPQISQDAGGSALVYGTAAQNQQGKIGFQVAATSGLHVGPGVVGWQPMWMTQP